MSPLRYVTFFLLGTAVANGIRSEQWWPAGQALALAVLIACAYVRIDGDAP